MTLFFQLDFDLPEEVTGVPLTFAGEEHNVFGVNADAIGDAHALSMLHLYLLYRNDTNKGSLTSNGSQLQKQTKTAQSLLDDRPPTAARCGCGNFVP